MIDQSTGTSESLEGVAQPRCLYLVVTCPPVFSHACHGDGDSGKCRAFSAAWSRVSASPRFACHLPVPPVSSCMFVALSCLVKQRPRPSPTIFSPSANRTVPSSAPVGGAWRRGG